MPEQAPVPIADLGQSSPVPPNDGATNLTLPGGPDRLTMERLSLLLGLSHQLAAETTVDALLACSADAARQLVGAHIAVCGYGYRPGPARVGAPAYSDDAWRGIPRDLLALEARAAYLDIVNAGGAIRIDREQLAWRTASWGLGAGQVPAQALLAVPMPAADGQPDGVIMALDGDPQGFGPEEEALLGELAVVTSLALHRLEARGEAQDMTEMAGVTEMMQIQTQLRQANDSLAVQAEELEVQAEELRAQNDELIHMSTALAVERARLEAVLQQMPGGVVIAEAPSGRTILTNHQVEEILRGPYSPAAGPGEYMQYQAFSPDGRPYPAENAPLTRSLLYGHVVTGEEMLVIRGDGSRATVLLNSRPVYDQQGQIVAAVVTFSDITERKEMEEALRRAHDELELRVEERTADLVRANQALQYQAHLLANVHDAIIATDPDYVITAWNRAAEELYGWPEAEAVGRPLAELIPTEPMGGDIEDLIRTVRETGRLETEFVQHRRDGTSFIVEARVMAMAGPPHEPAGYIATTRDVTKRKRAEEQREAALEELRTSAEVLRQLAETVNEVFWVTDGLRQRMLYVNPAYETIWGRSRQSLYDDPSSYLEAIHPDDRERVLARHDELAGQPWDEQYRIVRGDGSVCWVRVRESPIRNSAGEPYLVAGVGEDVTEQVHSLQQLEDRAAERTRQLSTLLTVSHHMAAVLQIGPLVDLILDGLHDIVPYSGAAVYRLDGDDVVILAYRGPLSPQDVVGLCFPVKNTVGLEEVLARREPVVIPDTQADTPLARAWRESPHEMQRRIVGSARSWLAVPLRVKDRIIGLLRLDHLQANRFTIPDAELALAFADHAAVAMENARLYEQVETLAAMEERQRLARDLHDAVSQTLFSASLIADVLPRVWGSDHRQGEQSLRELQQLTRGAMAEMRTLLLELRPAALTQAQLAVLLRHLTEAAASHAGIPIDLQAEEHCPVPDSVQVALYRIAQEALNNVVKHAEATAASVTLECAPEPGSSVVAVKLTIADNGRGFEMDRTHGGSFGLDIMHERASAIGAALAVTSGPGRGTRIAVTWHPEASEPPEPAVGSGDQEEQNGLG